MPVSTRQKVSEFYDDTADAYDRMMDEEISLPLYAEALGGMAERISGVAGAVLDASCGSGHMLARLAAEYVSGRRIWGVDLSPRMVAIAQARLGDSATVLQGDMANLPPAIAPSSCAAVISFFSLHHLSLAELAPCLAEWTRVLAPGGQLLLAAWEGEGAIDYGDQSDIVTRRYRESELVDAAERVGLTVDSRSVEPVEGVEMDAVYVSASKPE